MRHLWAAAAMGLGLSAAAWAQSAQPDPVEQALSEFRKSWSEAKTLPDRARALHGLAVVDVRDPRIVRAVGKFLNPMADDPDFILAAAAAEELGGFRSDAGAASLLLGATQTYRKVPRMQMALIAAMGRNGSASLVPFMIEKLHDLAANPDFAQASATALASMPVEVALPAMLKEWSDLNKKRYKEPGFGVVTTTLQASAQKMTGTLGMTVADFEVWWARNSQQYVTLKKQTVATGQ
jgi:hypothetical protein